MLENNQQSQQELNENSTPQPVENPIPPQYQGMPSEIVEELWQNPIYVDEEKNKSEIERRNLAIEAIKKAEFDREAQKQQFVNERYVNLSDFQKSEFPNYQKEASDLLSKHIRGEEDLENLSGEEAFVLQKLKDSYENFKKDHPNEAFNFQLEKDIDKSVYNNLVQKLSFKVLENKQIIDDQEKANKIRENLGIPKQEVKVENRQNDIEKKQDNEAALTKLEEFFNKRIQTAIENENSGKRGKGTSDAFRNLFESIKKENNREKITELLLTEVYLDKRLSNYKSTLNYEENWNLATQDNTLSHRETADWIYRGNFKKEGKSTETRGSLNVNIDEELIHELDNLIKNGIIDANYKFGRPDTQAAADARHDAITIYFLSEPTEEAQKALSDIAKKHYRGDNLLGRKISDGFYISEVGSVSDAHAGEFVERLKKIDLDMAKSVEGFLKSDKQNPDRIAMSEAQFYSVKDTLNLFGFDMKYDKDKGIEIIK